MPVGAIFDSGQLYAGRAHNDAIAAAHFHHIPVILAKRGMHWSSTDGVSLDVLAPSLPFLVDTGDAVNENSIEVMLRYRGLSELFMGDAGEASEARLLNMGDDLAADAIKVGHHGSHYASMPEVLAVVGALSPSPDQLTELRRLRQECGATTFCERQPKLERYARVITTSR